MGIKGAWSLLSTDPRRFGKDWNLRDDAQPCTSSCVFIDGPSLLYHVAVNDVYDLFPPLSCPGVRRWGSTGQASPATVYVRVKIFVEALLDSFDCGNVHAVMDGLAPLAKLPTQVDRLCVMARQGEAHATNPQSRCGVLHVLAETAMIEALQDLTSGNPSRRVTLHQPARGEAETYIDNWIGSHELEKVFVLSDDTDFLVYPSCTGFIPFKTLQFHVLDNKLTLVGFQYLRSKFIHAFFPREEQEQTMTTVAALAGCDYTVAKAVLGRARTYIVQSDIGGLRKRQRNDPSKAGALTAILRYVAHAMHKSPTTWLEALGDAVCKDAPEKKLFLAALFETHGVYFPSDHAVDSTVSVECRRLVEYGVVFCRPLIETWEGGSQVWTNHPCTSRKRRKSGKRQRKKRNQLSKDTIVETDVMVEESESGMVSFPPSNSFVKQCCRTGSAWSVFNQVRLRLYMLLRQCSEAPQPNDHHIQFNPTWTSRAAQVTEYIRVGRGANVDFTPSQIAVSTEMSPIEMTASATLEETAIAYIGGRKHEFVRTSTLDRDGFLLLASLMLPARPALVLLLLAKAPSLTREARCPVDCVQAATLDENLLLISLALFHASLTMNVLKVCSRPDMEGIFSDAQHERTRVWLIFQHNKAAWIWTLMPDVHDEDETTDNDGLVARFFERLRRLTNDENFISEKEQEDWRKGIDELWKTWCLLSQQNKSDWHDSLK